MAHEIFGERFISRGKSAWHGLGQVFAQNADMTVEEAMVQAKIDYEFGLKPLYHKIEGERTTYEALGDKRLLVRKPTQDDPEEKVLDVVGPRYEIMQNLELARVLDRYMGDFPVETAGALKKGERVFVALRGGTYEVAGADEIKDYFVIEFNQLPGRSHALLLTPVRTVCANTLSLGKSMASVMLKVPHTNNHADLLEFGVSIMAAMRKSEDSVKEIFDAMSRTKLTDGGLERILAAAYPSKPRPRVASLLDNKTTEQLAAIAAANATQYERVQTALKFWESENRMVERWRDGARTLYEKFNDEHPRLAQTVWAAYQAVAETSDWRNSNHVDPAESTLFGLRADEKRRGFEQALTEMNVSLN